MAYAALAVAALSSYQEGKFNEKVAKVNAEQARLNAEQEAVNFDRSSRREQASDIAARSAFGSLGGSDFATIADAALQIETDRKTIIHGGRLASTAFKLKGKAAKRRGDAAALGNALGAVGSGIKTFGGPSSPPPLNE